MDSKATLTIPLSEYMEIQKEIGNRDAKITKLEAELLVEKQRDPEDRFKVTLDAVLAAVPIIRFAVEQLPPETVRGWPYKELMKLGELMQKLPLGDHNMVESGRDWQLFAKEIRPFEEARAAGGSAPARTGSGG